MFSGVSYELYDSLFAVLFGFTYEEVPGSRFGPPDRGTNSIRSGSDMGRETSF